MQLIETRVSYVNGAPKVDFFGEGGELVSVILASRPPGSLREDEKIIETARAMMIQMGSFSEGGFEDGASNADQHQDGKEDDQL